MIDWTHDRSQCPEGDSCPGTTECERFPLVADRIAQVEAAYQAYAESDGTSEQDFVVDVLLWGVGRVRLTAVYDSIIHQQETG